MPEEQTQQGDPIDTLYKVVSEKKLFKGSLGDFKAKYNSPASIDELYNDVKTSGLFTQDKFDFYDGYFPKHREEASYDRLHKAMKSVGYEGSEKEFKNEFSGQEGVSKLYHILNGRKLFTDSQADFEDAYFPSVSQKKVAEKNFNERFTPYLQKKNTSATSQGGESVSELPKQGTPKTPAKWVNDVYKEGEVVDNSATRMHGGGRWEDVLKKKHAEASEAINKLKGTPLFEESLRSLAQKNKETRARNQAEADINSRPELGAMDNIAGVDPNTRNRILSNKFAPREISQYDEHDYQVAKAEVGNGERNAAIAMLMHDPNNKELQEHAYVLNHGVSGRNADTVEQNIKDIREGKAEYRDGILVKPEGAVSSLVTGAKQTIKGFNDSMEFLAKNDEDRKIQLEKEYQHGYDPDEQIPVPKGMLAKGTNVVGGLVPLMATAGATGGTSLSAALTFGITGGVEGGSNKMKEEYAKLRNQGYDENTAYEQARDEAAKAAVVDYGVNVGMGYASPMAESIVGKGAVNTVDWGSGWKNALKDVRAQLPHDITKLPVEAGILSTEGGVGSALKGEDEKKRWEAIVSNAEMVTAFHLMGTGVNYAKGVTKASLNSLKGGLSRITDAQLETISKAAVDAGFNTPEEALRVIEEVKARRDVENRIPDNVKNTDVRDEVAELIEKRDALDEKKKTEDAAFAPKTKEKIDELNEKIVELSNSKEAKEGPKVEKPEEPVAAKPKTEETDLENDLASIFGNKEKEAEALDNELAKIFPKQVKPTENAIQESGPSSLLPHPQEGVGETGGKREGVGQGIEGQKAPEARTSEATAKEEALKKATKPEPTMEFMQKNDLRKLKDLEGGVKEHDRIKNEYKTLKKIIDCLWA